MKPMRNGLLCFAVFAANTLATISAQGSTVTLTVDFPGGDIRCRIYFA